MGAREVQILLEGLTTPNLADAVMASGQAPRVAPWGLRPSRSGMRAAGPVLPVRHAGSVDIFLEALEGASPGQVMVIDDGGSIDQACIGDLIVAEVYHAGVAGILVWGLHRDSEDLAGIDLPVFSYGTFPSGPSAAGPRAADPLREARFGDLVASKDDVVIADEDGAIFVASSELRAIAEAATTIRNQESRQAKALQDGLSLRDQLGFSAYLAARATDPDLTLRDHLRATGGAVET